MLINLPIICNNGRADSVKSFCSPNRLIFEFTEGQMAAADAQAAEVKKQVGEMAEKGIDAELKTASSADEAIKNLESKMDAAANSQAEKMSKWETELRTASAGLVDEAKDKLTGGEKTRAEQADKLGKIKYDMVSFRDAQKIVLESNKGVYEQQKTQIDECTQNDVKAQVALGFLNDTFLPNFDQTFVNFKTAPDAAKFGAMEENYGSMKAAVKDAQTAVDVIKSSPVFAKYPEYGQMVTDLQGQIDQTKAVMTGIDSDMAEAKAVMTEEKIITLEGQQQALKGQLDKAQADANAASQKAAGKDKGTSEGKDFAAKWTKFNELKGQLAKVEAEMTALRAEQTQQKPEVTPGPVAAAEPAVTPGGEAAKPGEDEHSSTNRFG